MLWPDIIQFGRVTSDVTQFLAVGHITTFVTQLSVGNAQNICFCFWIPLFVTLKLKRAYYININICAVPSLRFPFRFQVMQVDYFRGSFKKLV